MYNKLIQPILTTYSYIYNCAQNANHNYLENSDRCYKKSQWRIRL